MKYKVGDTPTVRKGLIRNIGYGGHVFTQSMAKMQGKKVKIECVRNSHDFYMIEETDGAWTDEMFEDNVNDMPVREIAEIEERYAHDQEHVIKGDFRYMSFKEQAEAFIEYDKKYPIKTNLDVTKQKIANCKTAEELTFRIKILELNHPSHMADWLNRIAE